MSRTFHSCLACNKFPGSLRCSSPSRGTTCVRSIVKRVFGGSVATRGGMHGHSAFAHIRSCLVGGFTTPAGLSNVVTCLGRDRNVDVGHRALSDCIHLLRDTGVLCGYPHFSLGSHGSLENKRGCCLTSPNVQFTHGASAQIDCNPSLRGTLCARLQSGNCSIDINAVNGLRYSFVIQGHGRCTCVRISVDIRSPRIRRHRCHPFDGLTSKCPGCLFALSPLPLRHSNMHRLGLVRFLRGSNSVSFSWALVVTVVSYNTPIIRARRARYKNIEHYNCMHEHQT